MPYYKSSRQEICRKNHLLEYGLFLVQDDRKVELRSLGKALHGNCGGRSEETFCMMLINLSSKQAVQLRMYSLA